MSVTGRVISARDFTIRTFIIHTQTGTSSMHTHSSSQNAALPQHAVPALLEASLQPHCNSFQSLVSFATGDRRLRSEEHSSVEPDTYKHFTWQPHHSTSCWPLLPRVTSWKQTIHIDIHSNKQPTYTSIGATIEHSTTRVNSGSKRHFYFDILHHSPEANRAGSFQVNS